jgi:hypothetical protein
MRHLLVTLATLAANKRLESTVLAWATVTSLIGLFDLLYALFIHDFEFAVVGLVLLVIAGLLGRQAILPITPHRPRDLTRLKF